LSIEKKVLFIPEGVIDDDGASERNGVDVVDVEPGIRRHNSDFCTCSFERKYHLYLRFGQAL